MTSPFKSTTKRTPIVVSFRSVVRRSSGDNTNRSRFLDIDSDDDEWHGPLVVEDSAIESLGDDEDEDGYKNTVRNATVTIVREAMYPISPFEDFDFVSTGNMIEEIFGPNSETTGNFKAPKAASQTLASPSTATLDLTPFLQSLRLLVDSEGCQNRKCSSC
ncbi:hypothetical protein LOK49_LG12G00897 [Camellia lanceoleosa]|uniref:Uncharacterized protein n=1 Tax=Camellia lanceoleosa TaxID=1840588 RepID=A0ACC0FMU0_9ERIC|nr:hypothetical protein LOK49_LG12G00897 [Camellia lanceoleosa]